MLALMHNEFIKLSHRIKSWTVPLILLLLLFLNFMATEDIANYFPKNIPTTAEDVEKAFWEREAFRSEIPELDAELLKIESMANIQSHEDYQRMTNQRNAVLKKYDGKIKAILKVQVENASKPEYIKKRIQSYYDSSLPQAKGVEKQLLQERKAKLQNPDELMNFTAVNAIQRGLELLPHMILLILVLFSADAISSEASPETQKMMLINPISRRQVVLAKFLTYALSFTFAYLVILGLYYLFIGFTRGWGDPQQLILFNSHAMEQANVGEVMTLGQGIALSILRDVAYIFASIALCMVLSAITNAPLVSTSLGLAIFIFFSALTDPKSFLGKIFLRVYNFIWMGFSGLIETNHARGYGPHLSFPTMILSILISTIVLLFLAMEIYRRKDLKN